jgi:cullin-associated NEDD8-dissociated protein 1
MSRSNTANPPNYNDLLKKTEHYDKDERYMAISDLCEALKRNASRVNTDEQVSTTNSVSHVMIDPQTERRICSAVLGLLDDKSNDVQTVAVKALGVLLITVQEEQVAEIADRLTALVLDVNKSDLRDVYAIGLKTLVETVPVQMGNTVSARLINRLIDGVHKNSFAIESPSKSMTGDEKNKLDKNLEEIVLACLNVLTDLMTRFGGSGNSSITNQHEALLNVTLAQLASSRPNIRKRAGSTIGVLATVISDTLLHRLVDRVLEQIDRAEGLGKSGKKRARQAAAASTAGGARGESDLREADTRSLIRTVCTVSGTVGHRLNQGHVDRIVPIFLRFCDPDDAVTGDDECSDEEMEDSSNNNAFAAGLSEEAAVAMQIELRESCFAGFESFVLRCPALIQPHLDQIMLSALSYMRYDPNYSYGDEHDISDEAVEEVEDPDEEEEEEDEYSDEVSVFYTSHQVISHCNIATELLIFHFTFQDDMSDEEDDENWKVRRSAIRTLTAIVEATKHDPSKLWVDQYGWRKISGKKITVAGALINRFKERDENCRVDIIECFTRLLSYTVSAASSGVLVLASSSLMEDDTVSASGAVVVDFGSKVSAAIVKACEKQLSAKKAGERSKSSAIALLSTQCLAPGGIGGSEQITSVFRHVKVILSSADDTVSRKGAITSSKALKLESLRLVRIMLSCKKHDALHMKNALLGGLLPELCKKYDWYKVIAESLRVLMEIPPLIISGLATKSEQDSVAISLYLAIEPRLGEHDVDQEIKECALSAAASLLSLLHTSLSDDQKNTIFTLLLERLKNDTTRLAAIKTLSVIADAAQCRELDLSLIINDTLGQLSSMLRQQHRGLKQSSLECLNRLVLCLSPESDAAMDDGLFDSVLEDLGRTINPADLHLCSLGLSASTSILKARPTTGSLIKIHILPATLELTNSPQLQDKALSSMLRLFEQMMLSEAIGFDELHDSLTKQIGASKSSKQVVSNLAECISTIAVAASSSKQETIVKDTIGAIEAYNDNLQLAQLNLLVTGNIGRKVTFSSMPGVIDKLKTLYNQSFESSNEDIKHAAALALGRASAGSMDAFLPDILTALEESAGKKQYLLLSSLREFIHCYREAKAGGSDLSSSIPLMLPHLEQNCENEEEGVRTMVAECLGSLACIEPTAILPLLQRLAANEGEHKVLVKWTVGNAVKFAIGGRIK